MFSSLLVACFDECVRLKIKRKRINKKMFWCFVLTLLLLKLFADLTKRKCVSKNRLDGQTVILTGANAGIGKETLRNLAWRGARIIMACRNIEAAEKVRQEVMDETANRNILIKKLDISSFKSVRAFSEEIHRTEPRIDILIHNAGVGTMPNSTTENFPMTFATNLYGPFLLTQLLVDLMKNSSPSRIIFVSSLMGVFGKCDFNKLQTNGRLNFNPKTKSYSISKYAVVLLVQELTERLKDTNIYVNSLHPGVINTAIFDQYWYIKKVLMLFEFLLKSPEEGAQTTIHCAVADEAKTRGRFYVECCGFNIFCGEEHKRNGKVLWNKLESITSFKNKN